MTFLNAFCKQEVIRRLHLKTSSSMQTLTQVNEDSEIVKNQNQYLFRKFLEGDEFSIVNLFNTTFANYAGFVCRTPQYWIWSCLRRPDVMPDGVRVMTLKGKIVGYIVVGRSGNIWDMCYDAQSPDGEKIVSELLSWALDYVKEVGSDFAQINFPVNDKTVRKVCVSLDFSFSPPEYMFISILDFPYLIAEILKNNVNADLNCQFGFKLTNLPSSVENEFSMEINNGKVNRAEGSTVLPEIIIEADGPTLISLILSGGSIQKAVVTHKISFHPYWKIGKGVKLLSLMKNESPWFVPRADIG